MAGRIFVPAGGGPPDRESAGAPDRPDGAQSPQARRELLGRLATRIARIEGRRPDLAQEVRLGNGQGFGEGFGEAAWPAAASPALERAALHEVRAPAALDIGAAAGFALALGGVLTGFAGTAFWVAGPQTRAEAGAFYGPGLAAAGFDPARLLRVHSRDWRDALWAAGEVAATPGAGFCLVELRGHPPGDGLTFSRRLALRSAASGVPVLLLRQGGEALASAAATRWRVTAAPSPHEARARKWLGPPLWHVTIEKGGRPGSWIVEWNSDERVFSPRDVPRAAPFPGARPALARDRPAGAAALGYGLARRRAS